MPDNDAPWQQWLDRHGPALLLLARQITGTQADAEDALQEGFVRFWRARGRARHAPAMLYAAVRSAALDALRSAARRQAREQDPRPQPLPSTADLPALQAERQAAIDQALHALPAPQREVVVMRIWGGLSFAEIAQATGESINTVASRYRYAMEKLATGLKSEVPDGR